MKSLVRSENRPNYTVRSYVIEPYKLVKDLRTGVSTSAVSDVLDGDLDAFLEASLAAKVQVRSNPNAKVIAE